MSILKDYPPANEDGTCSTGMYLGCVDDNKLYYVCGVAEGRKSSDPSVACDINKLMRDSDGYYPSCSTHPKTICKDQPNSPIINPEKPENPDNNEIRNKKKDKHEDKHEDKDEDKHEDKKEDILDNHPLVNSDNSFVVFIKSKTGIVLLSIISIILLSLFILMIIHNIRSN